MAYPIKATTDAFTHVTRPILASAIPDAPSDPTHPAHLAYQYHEGDLHSHHHHHYFFHHRHRHDGGALPHTHAASHPLFNQHPEVASHPSLRVTKPQY